LHPHKVYPDKSVLLAWDASNQPPGQREAYSALYTMSANQS
jgi:hypothetical protein